MPSIGHGIFHAAKKWIGRGGNIYPPPPVGETCLTNQYRSSDGFCFVTIGGGEPLVFGVVAPDATANQYATINDGTLITTTTGEPLVYGVN